MWRGLLLLLLIVTALALCVRSTFEPDIWWQIRTGEYILEQGSVPENDVFSYTYPEVKWINVKWFTEVLMALLAKAAGVESLFLLQMLVICGILLCLLLQHKYWAKVYKQSSEKSAGFFLALLLFLICFSFRMNGRPEMVSHLFTAITCLIFLKYQHKKQTIVVVAIIPLQILWANMHEAYGIGTVFWLLVLGGLLIENLLKAPTERNWKAPLVLSVISAVSFFATAVSPHGTAMYTQPINIFRQLGENQFTTELISFAEAGYWDLFAVLNLLLFLCGANWLLKNFSTSKTSRSSRKKKRNSGKNFMQGLPYLFLFLAFFYLSLKSHRNIPFFLIVGFPAIAAGISQLSMRFIARRELLSLQFVAIFCLLFYISIVSNFFYSRFLPKINYGWNIDESKTPHGAAEFIRSKNIKGKAYTDFLVSSYLLWYLQPEFKTFIDLRDLDIFPPEFFKNNMLNYQQPQAPLANGMELWDFLVKEDDYDYIVLTNKPNIINLQRHLVHNDTRYDLVFADNVASVYLKNSEENNVLIQQYGLSTGNNVYRELSEIKPGNLAKVVNFIFNPFYVDVPPDDDNILMETYYSYINHPIAAPDP